MGYNITMQVFSGSSNLPLAKRIADSLMVPLGNIEISQFANGETRVWVSEKKVDKHVVVVQSLSTPTNDHLIEFCLICDALHRAGASEITAVIPWMGYSKQDKVFRPGEPLSAKVVAQIIHTAHPSRVITIDLHNRATLGFFDIPIVELSAKPLFLEHFAPLVGEGTIVVAPDAGSVKAGTSFAGQLNVPVVYVDKKRDLTSGRVEVAGMSRSVHDAHVIIVDDNVFTGSTLLETVKELKAGGVRRIDVAVTHHLNVAGVQEQIETSDIDTIVVTDTITPPSGEKLKILSVASLVADNLPV